MIRIHLNRHRTTWGGIAGMALLAFALLYRFFPHLIYAKPSPLQPAVMSAPTQRATPASSLPLSLIDGSAKNTAANEETIKIDVSTKNDLVDMGPPIPESKKVARLLQKANQALENDQWFAPKEENALALFQQVLMEDKTNRAAKEGLKKIQQKVMEQITLALEKGDENETDRLLVQLVEVNPKADEIKASQAKLKILKQVNPLLAQAAELLKQEGTATHKETATLVSLYHDVLKLDPTNKVADQGLAKIERSYLDRALEAVAKDDFQGVEALLNDASRIRPGSQELLDTRSRIEGLRRNRANILLEKAYSALDSGNSELAEQLAKQAITISADLPGMTAFDERLKNARLYASYRPGQVINDTFLDRGGKSPALVIIPTGHFNMGSPKEEKGHRANEEPQRRIVFSTGFALGQNEISVGEFREFIKASGYPTEAEKKGSSSVYDENSGRMNEQRGITWQHDYRGMRAEDKLPVIHISWRDANAYIDWLRARTGKPYRLPSEAEFEYVLRAGTTTRYWWGDANPSQVIANVTGDKDRSPSRRSWSNAFPNYNDGHWGPAPVRSYPANLFGIYDLDGNVSEWVEDCWHDSYLRAPPNNRAWTNPGCTTHVVRGGSWGSASEQLRSAFRLAASNDTRNSRIGFRVARDL